MGGTDFSGAFKLREQPSTGGPILVIILFETLIIASVITARM